MGHGLPETAEDDGTDILGEEEPVWTVRKYIRFVYRTWELCDEIAEKEINSFDTNTKSDGKEYAPLLSEVLRVNVNNCVQINACPEADNVVRKKCRLFS